MITRRSVFRLFGFIAAAVGCGVAFKPKAEAAPIPFARTGEVVTCEAGHKICVVARDIFRHEKMQVEQFTDWTEGNKPQVGDKVRPCAECGADYIYRFRFGTRTRAYLYVGGEWRPPLPTAWPVMAQLSRQG